MAYDPKIPPALLANGIGGATGLRHFAYKSTTDTVAQILAAGYFTNAAKLGMRPGDALTFTDPNNDRHHLQVASIADVTGAGTVEFPIVSPLSIPTDELEDIALFPATVVGFQNGRQFQMPIEEASATLIPVVSQAQAEEGVYNLGRMTPLRGKQQFERLRNALVLIAIADGVTDVSAAWNTFVAACISQGRRGIIPAGSYYIPSATAVSITADLDLAGDGKVIIDGGGTAANYLFRLTNKSLRLADLSFVNFTDVISAGDGSGGSMPTTLTGNVAEVILRRVNFTNCRRPMFFISAKTGPTLDRLEITDCIVDGSGTGWAGFYCGWTNINTARVNRNAVRNINGTAAGYGSGGSGAPVFTGVGRAINVGGNNPAAGYAFARWEANDNIIENILDTRNNQAGVNPEVGGIRMTGARFVSICRNKLSNIKSTGTGITDDCEGIYPKAGFSVICENTLDDVGIGSASIIIKGYNRAQNTTDADVGSNPSAWGFGGVCSGNVIRSTAGGNSGIAIYSSEWIVDGNYIEGCGGNSSRFAPIWTNAAQNDNIVISENLLINSIGNTAIYMQGYGKNIRIEGNTIDGLTNPAAGSTPGIYINNTNGNGFNATAIKLSDLTIAGNKIGGIVAQGGSLTRGITLQSGGSNTIRSQIKDNILTSVVDTGIQISNGTHEGIKITGNDLRLAVDKYSTSGSPTITDLAANDNAGWLYGETTIDPPSLIAGAVQLLGSLAMDDVASRDVFDVTPSGSMSGTRIWAQCDTAGQVDIYQWNPTAASVNIGSRTFRVSARKIAA